MVKNKMTKKISVIAGTALIAGALLFVPSLLASGSENGSNINAKSETPLFSVKTASAKQRTLRSFLEVNGDIVSAQQADVFPDASGKLVSVTAALGARVRKGDIIAEVDSSKPGATYMRSPVYAPISGTVSKTPLSTGMTVSTATSITAIAVVDNLEVSARIPEREIAGLATGLSAELTLQAYPGETFTATITHVSPIIDSASRTKLITLNFDHADSRINAGMFARVKLNTRIYHNVLTIPSEAIISNHGASAVYVMQNGKAALREISNGVTLDGWTEIKSGLIEGDAVIIQGQQLLSDGASVRVSGNEV